jgi:hypothetical protein
MAMAEVFNKFEDFEIEYMNAKLQVQTTRGKAAAGELPEQTLREHTEAAYDCCRRFRRWCREKRDGVRQMLADPKQDLSVADRQAWQLFCDELEKRLPALEAECPTG